jgi:hypothetical protein
MAEPLKGLRKLLTWLLKRCKHCDYCGVLEEDYTNKWKVSFKSGDVYCGVAYVGGSDGWEYGSIELTKKKKHACPWFKKRRNDQQQEGDKDGD